MWTLRVATLFSVFWLAFTLTGCLEETLTGNESGSTVVSDPTLPGNPSDPPPDPARTLCDPFKTNSPQARDRGLVGNLLYLTADQPRYNNVMDYINNAAGVVPATIYLDRLFTPTRPFDRGFFTEAGDLVQTEQGNTLYEYFALRMESQLQLAANESPGYYQMAVLADDGALLKIPDENGGYKILVNNDGTHSTRLACATEKIYLDHNTKIPMIMEYYQGPRFHISLVAMWRPWPDGVTNAETDPFCGQQGNNLFFDSTKDPVVPKAKFYELLARDWKVLENENYFFPAQESNPCVPTELPLAITAFSIQGVFRDRVTLVWTTNIPSSSQGKAKNVVAGTTALSAIDETLVENHSLTITGLLPNTLYSVQALSGTPGGQSAISDERAFRTPR